MAETTTTTTITEAPAPASAPAKKKKAKRSVPAGQLHVKATFNNTIITITDKKGEVIATASAGACGFRGSKKGTAYAAQVASEKALSTAKQNNNLSTVDVFVNGIGQGRDAAIRAAMTVGVDVETITDKTGVPHGGVRPRKVRHP
jgi:small subunit ribosomal protein S11